MSGDYRKTSSGNFCVMRRMTTNNRRALREGFKKKSREYNEFGTKGGRVSDLNHYFKQL